jgi:hypothetical protein
MQQIKMNILQMRSLGAKLMILICMNTMNKVTTILILIKKDKQNMIQVYIITINQRSLLQKKSISHEEK